jgi:hypothetical protein
MSVRRIRIGIRALATVLAVAVVVGGLWIAQATRSVPASSPSFKVAASRASARDDDDNNTPRKRKCKPRYTRPCRPHHDDDDD